jgi:hypothetical protein
VYDVKDHPSSNVKGFGKGLHTNSAIIFNSGGYSGKQIVRSGGFLHIEPPLVIGIFAVMVRDLLSSSREGEDEEVKKAES